VITPVRLADVSMHDAARVGRKAASLGELLAADGRVPEGVVLPVGVDGANDLERGALARSAAALLGGTGPFAVRSSGVSEDGAEHSYAGIYETVLDVRPDGLDAAVERCVASAREARAAAYESDGSGRIAVIIQRMVVSEAAGVALTADPISGDRASCVVTAVRGTGDRLVSGEALGDEWAVRDGRARHRRRPERAIGRQEALMVAREARRIAHARGAPQDIEWAIDGEGVLWILQARPMTALPPDVTWEAPAPGAYTRALRFGEWISGPVTPLFESWPLSVMEARLHELNGAWTGQVAPRPYHVVVNGWYFYSLNFLSGRALARSLPGIVRVLLREPRRVAVAIPPTVRHSLGLYEREWRQEILPAYRDAVAAAEARVETAGVEDLPALVDEVARHAGAYFASIAVVAGSAYKMEMNLAGFVRRHLRQALPGGHLDLLAGFEPPTGPEAHAVASLDWWEPPLPTTLVTTHPSEEHARVIGVRRVAEEAAFRSLHASRRRLRAFRSLLADTQRLVRVREEQVRDLTLGWPVMRRAVERIGSDLAGRGILASADEVFFLTRDEMLGALAGRSLLESADPAGRRAARDWQARLVPPLTVGRPNAVLRWLWDSFPKMLGAVRSDHALVAGAPASPGRATGLARVVRGPAEFAQLQQGEVLVAPLTAPAWTPLFSRAAAVVTDVGSAAAHASIIAREYGIPAVVGCGDATARIRTGMRVTVDGTTGNVELAKP
jgi:pyruvate,water dikinase